jgi:hypothetical protein
MFYSKTTSGFYTREIHGDNIPVDAVEITTEQHEELLQGQSQGLVITADENGYPTLSDPLPPTSDQLISKINRQRKAAERQGITHNNIRYAGSPEDRQTMDEAMIFAEDAGITVFSVWKDSDNEFHTNHPVSDVVEAYQIIGQNRMRLIELEGQYIAQVQAGELTEVDGLNW